MTIWSNTIQENCQEINHYVLSEPDFQQRVTLANLRLMVGCVWCYCHIFYKNPYFQELKLIYFIKQKEGERGQVVIILMCSSYTAGPLPGSKPHAPCCPQSPFTVRQGVTCIIPYPTMTTPLPPTANRSTTGETGQPIEEKLAIWQTQLTQSAVSLLWHHFSLRSLMEFPHLKNVLVLSECHIFFVTHSQNYKIILQIRTPTDFTYRMK